MSYALLLVSLLASAPPADGKVTGRITFEGEAPAPKKIEPTTDAAICGQQDLIDESLLVDAKTKGLRNVVVLIEGTKSPAPASPPLVDNYRCRFDPHVVIARAGEPVKIRNRDRFLHTAQAKDPKGKSAFNVALPSKDQETEKKLPAAAGPYSLHCDVHDWMRGWAYATKGELAAVTDESGAFEISGVPAGKHKVRLWHETLGEKSAEVEVKAGAGKLDFSFKK